MNYLNKKTPYLIAVAVCLAVGAIGAAVTSDAVGTWYPSLIKPSFNPPNAIFAPVWTILYILMGIAWGNLWNKTTSKKIHIWFIIQLCLNAIWSPLFFGAHQIGLAWLDIQLLWLAIVITLYYFFKLSKLSGWLLLPYLVWVSFANILNGAIWWLNR